MSSPAGVSLSKAVDAAIAEGRPVVALESSIIAQGFPRPDNLDLGLELLSVVRAAGAQPAVTAVADGGIRVGADEALLRRLAEEDCAKCGARDLAVLCQTGGLGATTVSATSRIAALAGIRVFATGGIGGVHRRTSPDEPRDVSADLAEMARSPVAVVSSGAKAILDLPSTLEMLESLGVLVLGFGCSKFPAFFCTSSGLPVGHRVDEVEELADVLIGHWRLGGGGALVCLPPPDTDAIPSAEVEEWLALALSRAGERGVTGAAVTPFLLAELRALSQGRTLTVNRSLALANARLGAALACAIADRSD